MNWLKPAFLLLALVCTSAWSVSDIVGGKFRFRCYFACVDQTSTQNDYVEMRDHCRELAQLKVGMAMKESAQAGEERSRKAMLVSLFSNCMATNGWTVPDGKDPNKAVAGMPAPMPVAAAVPQTAVLAAAPPSAAAIYATKREDQALLTRASECAFARSNASVSSLAATRAKACDLECEQALALSPSAPRPASCPPEAVPKYARGNVE